MKTTTTKRMSDRLMSSDEKRDYVGMQFTARDYVAGWRMAFKVDEVSGCDCIYPLQTISGRCKDGQVRDLELAPSQLRTLMAEGVYRITGEGADGEERLVAEFTLTK